MGLVASPMSPPGTPPEQSSLAAGGLFTSSGGLGFASAADRYVDPLDARGLETYSGGVTSRVWYTPPTEWNDLLFALNHEASETLHRPLIDASSL